MAKISTLLVTAFVLAVSSGVQAKRFDGGKFKNKSYTELPEKRKERLRQKGVTDEASFSSFKDERKKKIASMSEEDRKQFFKKRRQKKREQRRNKRFSELSDKRKEKLAKKGITDEAGFQKFKQERRIRFESMSKEERQKIRSQRKKRRQNSMGYGIETANQVNLTQNTTVVNNPEIARHHLFMQQMNAKYELLKARNPTWNQQTSVAVQ